MASEEPCLVTAVQSSRHQMKLAINGHMFYCDKKMPEENKYYWSCTNRYDEKRREGDDKRIKIKMCPARAISRLVDGQHAAFLTKEHAPACQPDPEAIAITTTVTPLRGESIE